MNTIMDAIELIEQGKMEQGIKSLKKDVKKANDEEKRVAVQIFLQLGFLQDAKSLLLELIKKYPNESELKIFLSDIYIELEQDEKAMQLLIDINEDDENYIQALLQLADLYQAQGLFEVAEQKLITAKKIDPEEEILDFALGELYFSIGEYKKSILYYERLIVQTEEIANVSVKERLGEAYAASGEYEKALEYLKVQNYDDPDHLFRLGMTAQKADRADIAIHAWEKVIEIDPHYSTVYLQLAKLLEEENRIEEAYKVSKKGLYMDEFQKELYFFAGTLAHQLGEKKKSEEYIRNAVALDPDYKEAVMFLVEHYKVNVETENIVELLTEIKKLGADDALYDWELARAYTELECYDDALNHYKEAYNTLNQDSDFMKEYGYFLMEEGRINEAIPILESYLSMEPLDGEVEDFLIRLKERNDYE